MRIYSQFSICLWLLLSTHSARLRTKQRVGLRSRQQKPNRSKHRRAELKTDLPAPHSPAPEQVPMQKGRRTEISACEKPIDSPLKPVSGRAAVTASEDALFRKYLEVNRLMPKQSGKCREIEMQSITPRLLLTLPYFTEAPRGYTYEVVQSGEALQGGFGRVILVKEENKKKTKQKMLAVKIIPNVIRHEDRDENRKEENLKEAEICLELSRTPYPYIIQTVDCFQLTNSMVLIMEAAPGGDLLSFLWKRSSEDDGRATSLTPSSNEFWELRVRSIIEKILLGILNLHVKGYVYSDLKPGNVMYDPHNPDALFSGLKLIDFGLVQTFDNTLNPQQEADMQVGGTDGYMPPEVIMQEVAEAEVIRFQPRLYDLYGVGALMWELFHDDHPPLSPKTGNMPLFYPRKWMTFYTHKMSTLAADFLVTIYGTDPPSSDVNDGNFFWTVEQALAHPWFEASEKTLASQVLSNLNSGAVRMRGAGKTGSKLKTEGFKQDQREFFRSFSQKQKEDLELSRKKKELVIPPLMKRILNAVSFVEERNVFFERLSLDTLMVDFDELEEDSISSVKLFLPLVKPQRRGGKQKHMEEVGQLLWSLLHDRPLPAMLTCNDALPVSAYRLSSTGVKFLMRLLTSSSQDGNGRRKESQQEEPVDHIWFSKSERELVEEAYQNLLAFKRLTPATHNRATSEEMSTFRKEFYISTVVQYLQIIQALPSYIPEKYISDLLATFGDFSA